MIILPSGEMWSGSGLVHIGKLHDWHGQTCLSVSYIGETDARLLYGEDAVAFRKYAERDLWEYDTRKEE